MAHALISSFLLLFVYNISPCSAVIYHLNGSEYQRMPALFSLDEYGDCLNDARGAYCLLQLRLHAPPGDHLMHLIQEYSDYTVKHYNHSKIDRGVCVEKTCGSFIHSTNSIVDLKNGLEACLNDSIWREYGLYATVSVIYNCDYHNEAMDINGLDWSVLAALIFLVMLNAVGSFYDYAITKRGKHIDTTENKYLLCFSIMRNWKSLICTKTDNCVAGNVQAFHGIKAIFNFFVVVAHVMLLITSFTFNTHDFEKTYENPLYIIVYNGMVMVSMFFFISGFLLVHCIQYAEQKRSFTLADIPKMILLRIGRLLPVLALALAVSVSWMRHLGSGPLWKHSVTNTLTADCRQYWWHTLLFFNNYMPDNKFCLFPTWHIAADTQVYMVVLTAYAATPARRRGTMLALLLLLGAAAPAVHVLLQDLDAIVILTPE